ncbi:hypothetical protein [Aliikangiella sp. G2MR2-5]|uniref:hypothetical protein n=1 Tax=Aliikangiella sp. G2MR2-5 TaxID=2788943 RepID=UPI0018A9719F|nr:hypothetical protein [Aliikangiella sp. G2MR2-5]
MIDGKFDVVFRGQIVKTAEIGDVKAKLGQLFKSSPDAIDRLFSGTEVAIRKNLDYPAAMKYQSAMKQVGALALIKEVESTDSESEVTENKNRVAEGATGSNTPPQESEKDAEHEDSGTLTIAETGAQILPPKVYEKREVDTSNLSLAAAGERILPEKEPEKQEGPSIDHLSLE